MDATSIQTVGRRAEGRATSSLQLVDQLLRGVDRTLEQIARAEDLALLARAMIFTIALGGGLFGASMGAFRGDEQIPYAAAKLPLAMLLTTAICAPALSSLNAALGRPAHLRRDLALVLCALARASLVLGALAPLVLLFVRFGASYHRLTLLVVLCCGLAGLVGLALLLRGLRAGAPVRGARVVAWALIAVFALVGTQMAWTLRPFLLRPRTLHVPLVRSVEGSFVAAVMTSWHSARGIYSRDSAPLPAETTERTRLP